MVTPAGINRSKKLSGFCIKRFLRHTKRNGENGLFFIKDLVSETKKMPRNNNCGHYLC
jgi:hypothetical protein